MTTPAGKERRKWSEVDDAKIIKAANDNRTLSRGKIARMIAPEIGASAASIEFRMWKVLADRIGGDA